MQGGPLSPTIFSLRVGAIVQEWVQILWVDHRLGFEDVWWFLAFFVDNRLVVARDPGHLHIVFNVLTGLFGRVGIRTTTTKTNAMNFLPWTIRMPLTAEAYEAQMVKTFRARRGRGGLLTVSADNVAWWRGPFGPTSPHSTVPTSATMSSTYRRGPSQRP